MNLSDVALEWMIRCGAKHGLRFKKSYIERHINPVLPGTVHDCFTGIWKTYGKSHRPITETCEVHKSVATQIKTAENYEPENLPANPKFVVR